MSSGRAAAFARACGLGRESSLSSRNGLVDMGRGEGCDCGWKGGVGALR
jgi:hypothetical protein